MRRATLDDAPELGFVAPVAYAEAYGYLWQRPQAYLNHLQTFGEHSFRKVLSSAHMRVWVAVVDDRIAGFLSMNLASTDPIRHAPNGAGLPRIYLLSQTRGMKLGRKLFDRALRSAETAGKAYLWLDVMTSADWAFKTYLDWGFLEVGRRFFGGGVRPELAEMIVMARPIKGT